jgi:Ca-activated chloride channel family protein
MSINHQEARMDIKTGVIIGTAGGLITAAILLEPPQRPRSSAIFQQTLRDAPVCSGAYSALGQLETGFGSFQGSLSQATITRSGGDIYATFELDARIEEGAKRMPLHIAIVIDRSGSMGEEQMRHAKEAAKGLIRRLNAEDQVAIIQYDQDAEVVMPLTPLHNNNRAHFESAIEGIYSRGSTNLHGGLILGRDELARSLSKENLHRVILVSDGLANAGVTDHTTLGAVASAIASQGIRVSTVGVGVNYDEDLMLLLAEQGRGQYHYVKDSYALQSVFDKELHSMQSTVATGVELLINPLCGAQLIDVFGYPTTKEGEGMLVPLSDIAGGDKRKVVLKLRADEASGAATDLVSATLRFTDPKTGQKQTINLSLGAALTDDVAVAEGSSNSAVMTKVLEAESAVITQQAAAAYSKGDVNTSKVLIEQGKAEAKKKAAKYQIAPSRALDAYDSMEKANAIDPFSAAGKDAAKSNKYNSNSLAK